MSRAGRSVFLFGIYVLLIGSAFVIAPAAMVSLLKLPDAPTGWLRALGLLALVIGGYDVVGGRSDNRAYIKASIYLRAGFAAGVLLIVLAGEMPVAALPLGFIDLAGAVWTAVALRAGRVASPAIP